MFPTDSSKVKVELRPHCLQMRFLYFPQQTSFISNHSYEVLDLSALCNHHTQVPHSLSGIYLHYLARDMNKKNGVTFPGSPLSMMEQELCKNLSSFSSSLTIYSLTLHWWRCSIFPKKNPSSNIQDMGKGGKHKGKGEVKERQGHDVASRDAHLWAVPPRVCSTWVISRHIFLTLRFGTDKTSPPISRATQQAVPEAIYYYCNCYWYVIRKALLQPQTREWTPCFSRSYLEHWHIKILFKVQQNQICWSEE